jgi:hypothetical protein
LLKDLLYFRVHFRIECLVIRLELLHFRFNFFEIAVSKLCILEKLTSSSFLLFHVTFQPLLLVEYFPDERNSHSFVSEVDAFGPECV